MQRDTKKNYQLYGRNDMIMLDEHNKIYGSLGLAEPYIVATKEGETLLLDGAKDNEPFIGLSLYGKSQQKTTTGAQLLNKSASGQSRGVSWQIDGSKVTFEGTTNDNGGARVYAQVSMLPDMEIGKTYYAKSFTDVIDAQFEVVKSSGNDYTDAVTLDGTETRINFRAIVDGSGGQNGMEVNLTAYVAVTENKNMTQWEPYTGGKPSPNPDYPQEIASVGDDGEIEVTVANDGYVEKGMALSVIKKIALKKGSYIYCKNDIFDRIINAFIIDDPDLIGTSAGAISNGNSLYSYCYNTLGITEIQNSGATITGRARLPQSWGSGVLYRIESDGLYLYYSISNSAYDDSEDCFVWFWDEELSTEREYKSQPLIVSTPNGLPGIPVSSGGNYTDENGQQWISDEIDFRRGKYVQRVVKRTFGANVNISQNGEITDGIFPVQMRFIEIENVVNIPGLCDNFSKGVGYVERFNLGYRSLYLWISVKRFDSENPTIEDVKNWLDQNPVTVYAPLATPIETDLTPEQITAYQSLHTNYPTTTVMNDEGAGMKAIYKQIENGG